MGELLLRMVFSLAVVVGLLILISRVAARRLHGRAGSPIEVLHRQALSKSASVSVVSVAGRVLVLGSTDQQVNVLTELDPDAFGTPETTEPEAHTVGHALDVDADELLATDPTTDELVALLAGSAPSYEAGGSLEALLAEPDRVTLEELLGHRGDTPSHSPGHTPGQPPVQVARADRPSPAPAAQDEEDPYLPEDPSWSAFAAALRAQLAGTPSPGSPTDHRTDHRTDTGARSGRHAAPAPAMELPPVVAGGARVARTEAPAAPAPTPAPHAAGPAPGPSAADLATLRAALLSAQLRAGSAAPTPTTVTLTRTGTAGMPPEGALGGSVLSPQTWRQAYRAVTRRAS